MAGGKQTPRQRMMGILYLVLLGLIALDVPDSLLDAFKHISDSLVASKTNVQTGINQTFKAFEATKLKEQHDRALPIYNKALKARQLSDNLNDYIETLKKKFIDASGDIDPATNDYKGRENLDVSVHMMINDQRYAYELHKKIDETRNGLLALLNDREKQGVNLSLDATAPPHVAGFPNKDWENANFGEGIPMAAAMTALIKIQSDTRNAENEVVKKILGEVDQAVVTLDQFNAVAVPNSNYVIAGQPYKAQIYLSAYDSKSNPTITVEGSSVPTSNGVGTYTTIASGDGLRTWHGSLVVKQVNGPPKSYPISGEYMVAKPSAVVSPDKMNVLYIGVPNPVTVSAPGVATSSLKLSISGGALSGGVGGHYIAQVKTLGSAKITVMGDKGLVLGTSEFRVKRIPDPKPEFAGKSGGNTSAANIRAQDKVFAKLDNFDFDAKFSVTRFTLLIAKPRQDAIILSTTGSQLSAAMRSAMSTVSSGTTIVFKDIVAVGPDGSQRGLDPIVISAN
ncbi:MAG: gliding motility protein GldM [Sphingobacteriales bacterium]